MNDPIITSEAISLKVTSRFILLTLMLVVVYTSLLLV